MLLAGPAGRGEGPLDRLGRRHGALADDARLGAGQVEHGRRRARKLAAVDDGRARCADLLGDVLESARIGATREVRARRQHRADPVENLGGRALELRRADADRVGAVAGEPREPAGRVWHDQRERPGQERPQPALGGAAQLRNPLDEGRDVAREQRGGLARQPALQPVDLERYGLARRIGAEPIDGVGRQHDRLARLDGADGCLDHTSADTPRNDKTASRKASGASTKMKWPTPGSNTVSASAISAAISRALDGPVMKSSWPVITSVGAVIFASSGRRSKVSKISRLKSTSASAFGVSARSISR